MEAIHPLVAISNRPNEEFWFEVFVGVCIYCTKAGFLRVVSSYFNKGLEADLCAIQRVPHDLIHDLRTTALQHVSLQLRLVTACCSICRLT